MSLEENVHNAQIKILRELLFLPTAHFAALQRATGLDSDHVKFHIKRLVALGYVTKIADGYVLSIKGKEYANKLDTDAGVIERQPKVAVLLVVERQHHNEKQYLLQQRLKHPYYGFWGAPTGKVRWAESVIGAAARELAEETGLHGTFVHRGVYHERVRHSQTNEIVEDKLFHLMFCDAVSGTMIEEFEGGKNAWRTREEMESEPKKYKSFMHEMTACIDGHGELTEVIYEYDATEF